MPILPKDNLPQKIKDFPIIKRIGKGGMGEVYLAKHPTLHHDIILKSLSIRGDKESSERFLQEASVMMSFHHENIVQVYDHFKEGRSTYIAMEYVNGKDLNALLTERVEQVGAGVSPIPIPIALFILYQVALGLHHAHTKNVIHRDIKPHNILLSVNGEVKIVDFGIARKVGLPEKNQNNQNITQPGIVVGTPAYMSPEQFIPGRELTLRTDIYSLGVVFYQMVTGQKPFKNEYTSEVISAIATGRYTPAHKIVKDLPRIVRKILHKMMHYNEKKRYKNLIPLIKTLRKYFKSYNIFEIKDSVKRLVVGGTHLEKSPFYKRYVATQKKHQIRRRLIWSSIVIVALAACFFATNMQYELLGRSKYGRVLLKFDLENMDPTNLYISIDEVTKKIRPKSKRIVKKFYLPVGEHTLGVVSGSYVNSRTLNVKPIMLQSRQGDGVFKRFFVYPSQECFLPIAPLKPQDVTIYFRFWDSLSDKLIYKCFTSPTMNFEQLKKEPNFLKVKIGSTFVDFNDYVYNKRVVEHDIPLYSGHSYKFSTTDIYVGKTRYIPRTFNLSLNLELRSVISHYYLDAAPATLVISSDTKCRNILINGKRTFFNYDNGYACKDLRFLRYSKEEKKYVAKIKLPPGDYQIKIGQSGKVKHYKLNSDSEKNLDISKKDGEYIY